MPKNKFAKLVHLVGLIIKKFVKMHGHMNVKLNSYMFRLLTKPSLGCRRVTRRSNVEEDINLEYSYSHCCTSHVIVNLLQLDIGLFKCRNM